MAVFVVAGATSLRGKIVLVPPFEFSFWRHWHPPDRLAADQITAHRDHCPAAFRPKCCDDVGCPRTPDETTDRDLLDLERIHKRDDINRGCRRLAVAEGVICKKPSRAVAPQVWHHHPIARGGQHRGDIDIAVNVVGPAVQKDDRRTLGRTYLC